MWQIKIESLRAYVEEMCRKLGVDQMDSKIMGDIYVSTTKRAVGHHDIHNFPGRIEGIRSGVLNVKYKMKKVSGFGAMEAWDGDHGPGELINYYAAKRAMELASEHGIGMVTLKNSNHYLCSAPFVEMAARNGYAAVIIAKGFPLIGLPGCNGKLVSQSPLGFSFPIGKRDPFILDMCLAHISGEGLLMRAENNMPVPEYWGVDADGNSTTNAKELMKGVKYPIGNHKGYSMAIFCEMLTGVLSGGLILDEGEGQVQSGSTSHTVIMFKTDGLMDQETYEARSAELIDRLKNRSENVKIPGERSFASVRAIEAAGYVELEDTFVETLIEYGKKYDVRLAI